MASVLRAVTTNPVAIGAAEVARTLESVDQRPSGTCRNSRSGSSCGWNRPTVRPDVRRTAAGLVAHSHLITQAVTLQRKLSCACLELTGNRRSRGRTQSGSQDRTPRTSVCTIGVIVAKCRPEQPVPGLPFDIMLARRLI